MSEQKNITAYKPENDVPLQITSLNEAGYKKLNESIIQQPSLNIPQKNEAAEIEIPVSLSKIQKNKQDNTSIKSHHTPKYSKKWKEYLFDFVMLFLAITAGFFVDNKREYYLEHERAKQFSRQLLADLRLDSVLFENIDNRITAMQKGFDSLTFLLTQKKHASDKEVLEILLPLTYAIDIPATSTTYNQMKSSGALRYIENPELTAHLQRYYDVLLIRSTGIAEHSLEYFSTYINSFYLEHIRIQDFDPFNDTLVNKNPQILERSSKTDQELANIMGGYRSLLKIQAIAMNEPAREEIKESILILKNQYNLE